MTNKKYILKKKIKLMSEKKKTTQTESKNNESHVVKKPTVVDPIKKDVVHQSKRSQREIRKRGIVRGSSSELPLGYVPNFIDRPDYIRKTDIDFDVAICISSFNRYDKLIGIINDIRSSPSIYSYKIFIMNDGSTDDRYKDIEKKYDDVIYIKNDVNGGKKLYWNTVTKLWSLVTKYSVNALCQIDDDFIICDYFINKLMDKFYEYKSIDSKYIAFRYHMQYPDKVIKEYGDTHQGVDGGTLYDIQFIKSFKYRIPEQRITSKMSHSKVWTWVSDTLRKYGGRVYIFRDSLAYHNGNEDSKLNPENRKKRKIYTGNFIDEKKISNDKK